MRFDEGGVVLDCLLIKDDQIGVTALLNPAPIFEPEACRRGAAQLPHGVFQRKQSFAYARPQEPRR